MATPKRKGGTLWPFRSKARPPRRQGPDGVTFCTQGPRGLRDPRRCPLSDPKPLPFLKALSVAWAIVKYLGTLNITEALSDGHLTASERKVLLRRALSPKAIEDLIEAVLDAAAPTPGPRP